MAYLVDTNVLLRYIASDDPDHRMAVAALDSLLDRQEVVCIVPQNLIEFWNVATRPRERNGFGLSTSQVEAQVTALEGVLTLLADTAAIYPEWRRLVAQYNVQGVQVHDTRLFAAMRVHGLTHLLTFNGGDYERFAPEGLTIVHPATLSPDQASPSTQ